MDADSAGHIAQLVGNVAPLAETQVVNEFGTAHAPKGRTRQVTLLDVEVAPEVEVSEEVRVRIGETRMGGVGRLLVVQRPFPNVLNR